MFTTKCFIRKNTPELRDKLEKLGYRICSCCKFEDNIWLNNFLMIKNDPSIHGIGAWDIEDSQEEVLNRYITDNTEDSNPAIDCGDNERLFLALVALRDDTDKYQWFFSTGWTDFEGNPLPDKWVLCDQDTLEKFAFVNNSPNSYKTGWKKATVEELIQHFK